MATSTISENDLSREATGERDERGPSPLSPVGAQTLTVGFRCNNRCRICLVEGMRDRSAGMAFETFKSHVDRNAEEKRFHRLVLSGAEVTLEEDLLRYIEYARDSGAYRHIRIQSNGRRFGDPDYARSLVAAGVDELYVSVRAHEPHLDQRITGRAGGFEEMAQGLGNLAGLGVTLITNTVLFSLNIGHLERIMDFVGGYRPARVELYGFVPVSPKQHQLMVSLADLTPALNRGLDRLQGDDREVAVTWLPRCILGERGHLFEPALPETMIEEAFWQAFPPFACFYQAACRRSGPCQGLPVPYIERFGWEANRLLPEAYGKRIAPASGPPTTDGDWRELLRGADGTPLLETSLWKYTGTRLLPGRVSLGFEVDGRHPVEVVLQERDQSERRDAQTAGFDVSLFGKGSTRPDRRLLTRFLYTLLPVLSRNDDGRLRIAPERKPTENGGRGKPCHDEPHG